MRRASSPCSPPLIQSGRRAGHPVPAVPAHRSLIASSAAAHWLDGFQRDNEKTVSSRIPTRTPARPRARTSARVDARTLNVRMKMGRCWEGTVWWERTGEALLGRDNLPSGGSLKPLAAAAALSASAASSTAAHRDPPPASLIQNQRSRIGFEHQKEPKNA